MDWGTHIINFGNGTAEDEYLVGDWDGDGDDEFAVRRGNEIHRMDNIWNVGTLPVKTYGLGNQEDEYLVGDWNGDGDGDDNIAVRRGNAVYMANDWDGTHDILINYGNASDQHYLVGDWDADGTDELAVRRGNQILMDFGNGVSHELQEFYEYDRQDPELSDSFNEYLVGNWVYESAQGFKQDDNFGIRLGGDHAFLDTDYDPVLEQIELFPF